MDNKNISRLKYRRQYLLAPRELNPPFLFRKKQIAESHFLYVHEDLPLAHHIQGESEYFLLGDIFDHEPDNKSNLDIIRKIASIPGGDRERLAGLERYTGCYVMIWLEKGSLKVVHDAFATRKIYTCRASGKTWCSSHHHLLARVLGYGISEGESKRAFFESPIFADLNNGGIAESTCYDEISQVLPNHYLLLEDGSVHRFWPDEVRVKRTVKEVVEESTNLIQGYMQNIRARYRVMLPITAGKDSRTLLAATRDFTDEVYYYINKVKGSNTSIPDFTLPLELSKRLGIDFHVLDTDIEVDKDFEQIFFENNPHALGHFLPMIYNYYLHFEDRVNLPGSIATGGQWWYPVYRKNKTVNTLLGINNLENFPHAREAYAHWMEGARPACNESGFELLDLFYWEERLGNWGTQIQMDKDMAQLDINPFNSRLLVKIMMSVEPSYSLEFASYPVNSGINMKLWPETMSMQINPGKKNTYLRMMEKLGLLGIIYRIKYR